MCVRVWDSELEFFIQHMPFAYQNQRTCIIQHRRIQIKNWNTIKCVFGICFSPFGWFGELTDSRLHLLFFSAALHFFPLLADRLLNSKSHSIQSVRYSQSVFINFHSHCIVLIFYVFFLWRESECMRTRSAYAMGDLPFETVCQRSSRQ